MTMTMTMTMANKSKTKTRQAGAKSAAKAGAAADDGTVALRAGPRKQGSSAPPAPRITRHKNRAAWFRSRVTWPLREARVEKLKAEHRRAARTLAAPAVPIAWQLAGPTNIGGRCTALVCDPADAARLWIGSAGGGVWKTHGRGSELEVQLACAYAAAVRRVRDRSLAHPDAVRWYR